jgi:hypothetical protein
MEEARCGAAFPGNSIPVLMIGGKCSYFRAKATQFSGHLPAGQPINFKTVAEAAGISPSWLYGNDDLRQRITHLRALQMPRVQVKIPAREQASSASKDAMIATLKIRVRDQAAEIAQLKRQVEVVYGLLEGKATR